MYHPYIFSQPYKLFYLLLLVIIADAAIYQNLISLAFILGMFIVLMIWLNNPGPIGVAREGKIYTEIVMILSGLTLLVTYVFNIEINRQKFQDKDKSIANKIFRYIGLV